MGVYWHHRWFVRRKSTNLLLLETTFSLFSSKKGNNSNSRIYAPWYNTMIHNFGGYLPTGDDSWLYSTEMEPWVTDQVSPQHELLWLSSRHQTGKLCLCGAEHKGLYILALWRFLGYWKRNSAHLGTPTCSWVVDFSLGSTNSELEELGEEVAPCLGSGGMASPMGTTCCLQREAQALSPARVQETCLLPNLSLFPGGFSHAHPKAQH